MKKLLIALGTIFMLTAYSVTAKEYIIDDYSFTWTASEVGNISLLIEKTQDKLQVIIRKKSGLSFDSLYLSPEEAKEIGVALATIDEYYKKQKDSNSDISEVVKAGNYAVTYHTSTKHGFYARISQAGRITISNQLMLDRKEGALLSKELQDILDKAEYLKNAVKL